MHISEKHNCNKPTRPIINIQSAMNSKQNLTIIASVNMTGDKTKAVILKRNIENVSAIFQHKKQKTLISYSLTRVYLLFLVPRPGVEPGWMLLHWCLRPARLPIPPSGQFVGLPGLEPRKTGPESVVLPLHHSPMYICQVPSVGR